MRYGSISGATVILTRSIPLCRILGLLAAVLAASVQAGKITAKGCDTLVILAQIGPIWRRLYIYVNPDRTWIRSHEGQRVARNLGYFPLPESMREKQP